MTELSSVWLFENRQRSGLLNSLREVHAALFKLLKRVKCEKGKDVEVSSALAVPFG